MRKIVFALIAKMLDAAIAYAASTPDPLDDMLLGLAKKIFDALANTTATDKPAVVAELKAELDK